MPRTPRQERARHKVELILDAAIHLLDRDGLAPLTTNAIAEKAGVSIGTLYQYFSNREAVLDALADREMAEISQRILTALKEMGALSPTDRIARIIRAVTASYGGRQQVHRVVMEHSLRRGNARLAPLTEQLVDLLTRDGRQDGSGRAIPMRHADAFVLTNAFAGVMRAMILWRDASAPPQDEIEDALGRLILRFTGDPTEPR